MLLYNRPWSFFSFKVMCSTAALIDSFYRSLDAEVRSGLTSQGTRDWYEWQLKKVVAIAGTIAAVELRPLHLVELDLTHHVVRAIKRLFRWATDQDLVPKDAFAKLRAPRCGSRSRTLTRSEIVCLYRATSREFRKFLFFMRHTIARSSEVRRFKWEEIDFEGSVVRLSEFKSKDQRTDGMRERVIALDLAALSMLTTIATARLEAGHTLEGPVLLNTKGQPWTGNALRCAMREARERAGLDRGRGERVVCTTLRHTSATNAINNGTSLKLLAEMMGHTTTRTTERYLHLRKRHLVEGIDQATRRSK